ncbi:MAG: nucleotide exchange factor GrpE [Myxococcota bacterium]
MTNRSHDTDTEPLATDRDEAEAADDVQSEAEAPEEATEEEEAEAAEEEEATADEAPQPPPDPRDTRIRLLDKELAEREKTLHEYIKAHKKAQADFAAFKQRLLRDQEQEAEAARARAVEGLLDVFDNLERSLDAVRQGGDPNVLREGVELVARQFLQQLEELGLTRHDPKGETFDPTHMDAIGVVPVTDAAQDNKVVNTVKPGYRFGDRELRPALVQVGRKA